MLRESLPKSDMISSMFLPASGAASISIALQTSSFPEPSVRTKPEPVRPFSVASRVTARQYSEVACMESVPAPDGRGKRASYVETERMMFFAIVLFRLSFVANFGAAADWQNGSGNKARLLRQQKHGSIRDHITVRDVMKQTHFVKGLASRLRIVLGVGPLLQHRSPHKRRTDRVDSDPVPAVVGRHRLRQGDHSSFGSNVRGMILLSK